MKKNEDEMRSGYKRSDFGSLERGKFFREATHRMAAALTDPNLAKVLPEVANEDETAPLLLGRSNQTLRKKNAV